MSSEIFSSNPINISNNIGSTTRIPILYPHEYEVWALHFEDCVLGLEDNGYLLWEEITLGPFVHSKTKRIIKTQKDYKKLLNDMKYVPKDEKDKLISNIREIRFMRFTLQSEAFRLVSSYESAKEIGIGLKSFIPQTLILSIPLKHSYFQSLVSLKKAIRES